MTEAFKPLWIETQPGDPPAGPPRFFSGTPESGAELKPRDIIEVKFTGGVLHGRFSSHGNAWLASLAVAPVIDGQDVLHPRHFELMEGTLVRKISDGS
jgi:hypothetical protein